MTPIQEIEYNIVNKIVSKKKVYVVNCCSVINGKIDYYNECVSHSLYTAMDLSYNIIKKEQINFYNTNQKIKKSYSHKNIVEYYIGTECDHLIVTVSSTNLI